MKDTEIWYYATPDGDVYPHLLACSPMFAVLLFDQTGKRRTLWVATPVDRSVYGRDWSPSPQEFVRLLEMASGRRRMDWMRAVPRAGEVYSSEESLGLEYTSTEWVARGRR